MPLIHADFKNNFSSYSLTAHRWGRGSFVALRTRNQKVVPASKTPNTLSSGGWDSSRRVPLWHCGLITITICVCEKLLTFQSTPPSIIPLYPPDSLVMQVEPGLSGPAFHVSKADYVLSTSGGPRMGLPDSENPSLPTNCTWKSLSQRQPFRSTMQIRLKKQTAFGKITHWPVCNAGQNHR